MCPLTASAVLAQTVFIFAATRGCGRAPPVHLNRSLVEACLPRAVTSSSFIGHYRNNQLQARLRCHLFGSDGATNVQSNRADTTRPWVSIRGPDRAAAEEAKRLRRDRRRREKAAGRIGGKEREPGEY